MSKTPNPADLAAWSGKTAKTVEAQPDGANPSAARYSAADARRKVSDIVKKEAAKKKGFAVTLGSEIINTPRFSASLAGIDYVLGGGVPLGHQIEISGWEGSSKTTSALTIIAAAQKEGLLCGFVDVEQTFDAFYASSLGVDLESLVLIQPKTGEEALEVLIWMLESGITIICLDSIASMLPAAEAAGDIGDSHMSLQARLVGQAFRKTVPLCRKYGATILWINQVRQGPSKYKGDSGEYTPGGNAPRFFSSIRIRAHASKKSQEGSGDDRVGVGKEVTLTAFKNKTAPEDRRWRFFINYGEGFDTLHDLVKAVSKFGALERKASWFWMDGERLCNGADQLKDILTENPELREKIEKLVAEKIRETTERARTGEISGVSFNDDPEDETDESGLPRFKPSGVPLVGASSDEEPAL